MSTELAKRASELSASELADLFDRLSSSDRDQLMADLIVAGFDPEAVNAAFREMGLRRHLRRRRTVRALLGLVGAAAGAAGAYHGYKRNQSVPWAIAWFAGSAVFPVLAVPIMVAQGFAKQKGKPDA
jgi:hypothetical protein